MSDNYRQEVIDEFDKIEDELYTIIQHCESGDYSMREIADQLKELRVKVY